MGPLQRDGLAMSSVIVPAFYRFDGIQEMVISETNVVDEQASATHTLHPQRIPPELLRRMFRPVPAPLSVFGAVGVAEFCFPAD